MTITLILSYELISESLLFLLERLCNVRQSLLRTFWSLFRLPTMPQGFIEVLPVASRAALWDLYFEVMKGILISQWGSRADLLKCVYGTVLMKSQRTEAVSAWPVAHSFYHTARCVSMYRKNTIKRVNAVQSKRVSNHTDQGGFTSKHICKVTL